MLIGFCREPIPGSGKSCAMWKPPFSSVFREDALFCREALFDSRQIVYRVPGSRLPAKLCLPKRCMLSALCREQFLAKTLPSLFGPSPSISSTLCGVKSQ